MTAKEATDKNIITKQVVINTPTSARLLPITADEKVIDEIQQSLTELEELKKRDTAMKPIEAMMTWQCSKCGKEIRNTFNSCPYCRTRIDWSGIYGSAKDE